jgi:eukaryotic-like serine/threonine-protein kinase
MSLSAGARLGPYEILSPLGAGGMGEVYRARDARLGRDVAVKVLPEALALDRNRLARFEQEARAASALNHPNIVTIHDIGREGDTAYIAMELVDGRTLREVSLSGALPVRRILALAAQIAEGLSKAHAAGIVHRDLKPENVMVSKDGFVKILDFGLAKLVEPESGEMSAMPTLAHLETHPGTVMGTVAYMSPEQASGEALDFRSDQFSLGSIVYEMTTGQKAFQRRTAAETMSAIIREEPEPVGKLRPEMPLPVRWMLDRCLAKDKEERYASTRDLARDLASVRDHISEVTSGSEALLAATRRPQSRVPALALGVVLLAAAGLAGWLARSRLAAQPSAPRFTRLTFRQGSIANARLAPDGQTVVYGARWVGDPPGNQLYRTQVGSPESAKFGFPGDILAISPSNELAILQTPLTRPLGTLARVPMSGGTPRQVLEGVGYAEADFSPDGKNLAVVHETEDGSNRLEFPIGTILVAGNVNTPRVSRDGRLVAFWENVNGTSAISVIGRDGKGKRILSAGWSNAQGAPCWSADGREVWFAGNERAGEPAALWGVDLSGKRRLVMRVPGHLELDDVSKDGKALLGHHILAQSVRFASASQPVERELAWLDASSVADLSTDGRTLLLNEEGEGAGAGPVVYLRSTDGSPAVRLGDGYAFALSLDGKSVLAWNANAGGKPATLSLLPTGPGQPTELGRGEFASYFSGAFLRDAKKVVFTAVGKDGSWHVYVQAVPGGKPELFRPEPMILTAGTNPVSPDGKYLFARHGDGQPVLIALDGSGPDRELPGLDSQDDRIPQWSTDSRHFYMYRRGERPMKVWLYDIATGQRQLWKEFPIDASVEAVRVRLTPGGDGWTIEDRRVLGQLYLVEGLQ